METTHKVFILEDDPDRIIAFRHRFIEDMPEDVVYMIKTTAIVDEAIDFLSHEMYDLVLLDHDLSIKLNNKYVSLEKTGYHLANWLAENRYIAAAHGQFISHSINIPGRLRIIQALHSIDIVCLEAPFLWEQSVFWRYVGMFRKKYIKSLGESS